MPAIMQKKKVVIAYNDTLREKCHLQQSHEVSEQVKCQRQYNPSCPLSGGFVYLKLQSKNPGIPVNDKRQKPM